MPVCFWRDGHDAQPARPLLGEVIDVVEDLREAIVRLAIERETDVILPQHAGLAIEPPHLLRQVKRPVLAPRGEQQPKFAGQTDRKPLSALRNAGRESDAESGSNYQIRLW